jgi:hypothetical protein
MLYKMTNFHLYRTEISRQLIFTRLREAAHTHSQSLDKQRPEQKQKWAGTKTKMGADECTDIWLVTTAIPVGHIRTKSLLNKTAVMRFRSPRPKASAPHPGHPGIYSLGVVLGVIHNPHHFILMGTSFTYFQVNFVFQSA